MCVCVFMPVPACGWSRKDYSNKGGSANQESGHVQPGNDSHIISIQCNTYDDKDYVNIDSASGTKSKFKNQLRKTS